MGGLGVSRLRFPVEFHEQLGAFAAKVDPLALVEVADRKRTVVVCVGEPALAEVLGFRGHRVLSVAAQRR